MFTDFVYKSLSHQQIMQCYATLQCFLLKRTYWITELTYIKVIKLSVKHEAEMAAQNRSWSMKYKEFHNLCFTRL